MNYNIIMYTLGRVLSIEAATMLLPMICAVCYKDFDRLLLFAICAAFCLVAGTLLKIKKPKNKTMYSKEGFITVALSWIFISLFGAIPFIASGYIPNFFDALFETVSGFTTTGASVLAQPELLPKSLLFWRSFTHWIGGMGVLVFLLAIFPSGGSNLFLIKAESPGPAVTKLVPKIKSTAKILYLIYLGITVTEIILLLLGGMPLFDALTITFGTVGTGGFGITSASMADYSPYLQVVVTVFMILCGIDFSLYYLILVRKGKDAFRSEEYRAYLAIIAVSVAIITFNCRSMFPTLGTTLRHAAFQVGSIITTTGYSTTDFNLWPSLSKTILVVLMFIGACAGSTGGGIKVSRILIMFKSIVRETRIIAHPRSTHKITLNGKVLDSQTLRATNVYFGAYFVIFTLSVLIITIDNLDLVTNFTAVASALNNIGPGLAKVGPIESFAIYSPLSTFVLTLDMLIGRLEIFPMLLLFSAYKKKR